MITTHLLQPSQVAAAMAFMAMNWGFAFAFGFLAGCVFWALKKRSRSDHIRK